MSAGEATGSGGADSTTNRVLVVALEVLLNLVDTADCRDRLARFPQISPKLLDSQCGATIELTHALLAKLGGHRRRRRHLRLCPVQSMSPPFDGKANSLLQASTHRRIGP